MINIYPGKFQDAEKGKEMENQIVCPQCKKTLSNSSLIDDANKHTHTRVGEMLSKHSLGNPGQVNAKRERFLALLRRRYGYSNDKAVDELSRLLKQFYRMNKSLGIYRTPEI